MNNTAKTSLATALENRPAMKELLVSPGWIIVAGEMYAQMSDLVRKVMVHSDHDLERDRMIREYRALKEVAEKPLRILQAANDVIEQEAPKEQLEG